MITVQHIRNVLYEPDRFDAPARIAWRSGWVVRDYLPEDFDEDGGNLVCLNHRPLTGVEVDSLVPSSGDTITAGVVPKGLGIPILIALGALTKGATVGFIGTLIGAAIDFIIVGAVGLGLSYGIQAIMGPGKIPKMGSDEGPTRNFTGIQDTVGNGYPIPIIYGQVRCGGHILSSFERATVLTDGSPAEDGTTTLYTQVAVGIGPISSIPYNEIQINGNYLAEIPDVTVETREGNPEQLYLNGFDETVYEDVKDVFLARKDPAVAFQTRTEIDALEVVFLFPQGLYKVGQYGNFKTYEIQVVIGYKPIERAAWTYSTKTISACTRSPWKAVWRAEGLERGQYDVSITRLTDDDDELPPSQQASHSSQSKVYAILEIKNERSAHPGIAMVGVRQIPSEQLNSSVPTTYTFLVKGRNDVRIYTSVSSYTTGWTQNPAWCCAHFLTDGQVGLGVSWDDIDVQSFLDWANYCDTLVDNGSGILEKRCTFDHIFDTYESADRYLEVFCQGSGALLTRRGSKWYVVLDQEDQMVWIANDANSKNVTEAHVSYLERANRIRVTFCDAENDYQRDSYAIELPDLEQGDFFVDTSRELWGVTRKSQVEREITRYLLHNKFDDWKIELETGIDSLRVQPGSIFGWTAYEHGVGIAGGRILGVDSTFTEITIDQEITLSSGKTYEIVVMHQSNGSISTSRIVDPAGVYQTIHAIQAWQGTLAAGDIYSVGEYNVVVAKYRCHNVTMSQDFVRKITGVRYDPQVYTFDLTAEETPQPPSIPDPRLLPPQPTDLILYEHQEFRQDGSIREVIDVDWVAPLSSTISHYEVWYRTPDDSDSWILYGKTSGTHYQIEDVETPDITYQVAVVSVSTAGAKRNVNSVAYATIITSGLTSQPPVCTGLSVAVIDGTLVAICAAIDPALLGPGGYYEWRRGETWEKSVLLERTTAPRLETSSYGRGTTYILVKAVNSVGNKSPTATAFQITLYGQVEENIILTQSEAPSWSGTLEGLQIVSSKLEFYEPTTSVAWVVPQTPTNVRGARFFSFGYPDPVESVRSEAYYTTAPVTVSGGQVVLARADASVLFEPIYVGLGTFDDANYAFDSPEAQVPFEGEVVDKVRVLIESRISTTDTNESSWSTWTEHRNRGEMTMKYVQFRLHVISDDEAYGVQISTFDFAIDLPDKAYSGVATVLSGVSQDVDYPTDYFVAVKRLLVTLIGGAVGYYFRITDQDSTGFTWEIRDSSGNLQPGTIHYEARGY